MFVHIVITFCRIAPKAYAAIIIRLDKGRVSFEYETPRHALTVRIEYVSLSCVVDSILPDEAPANDFISAAKLVGLTVHHGIYRPKMIRLGS